MVVVVGSKEYKWMSTTIIHWLKTLKNKKPFCFLLLFTRTAKSTRRQGLFLLLLDLIFSSYWYQIWSFFLIDTRFDHLFFLLLQDLIFFFSYWYQIWSSFLLIDTRFDLLFSLLIPELIFFSSFDTRFNLFFFLVIRDFIFFFSYRYQIWSSFFLSIPNLIFFIFIAHRFDLLFFLLIPDLFFLLISDLILFSSYWYQI